MSDPLRDACIADGRYSFDAYRFLFESLETALTLAGREAESGASRHVSGPELLEGMRALAERMIREGGPTPRSRIAFAFQLAVSRAPDVEEEELLKNLLRESRVLYRQDPQAAEDLIQIGHRTAAEELEPVELAAWTTVARAVLNLHETITRN